MKKDFKEFSTLESAKKEDILKNLKILLRIKMLL